MSKEFKRLKCTVSKDMLKYVATQYNGIARATNTTVLCTKYSCVALTSQVRPEFQQANTSIHTSKKQGALLLPPGSAPAY